MDPITEHQLYKTKENIRELLSCHCGIRIATEDNSYPEDCGYKCNACEGWIR